VGNVSESWEALSDSWEVLSDSWEALAITYLTSEHQGIKVMFANALVEKEQRCLHTLSSTEELVELAINSSTTSVLETKVSLVETCSQKQS
jgi:hypothetical protein